MAKNKKLWIDMCAGSELKDTQGETLSVEGADIADLEAGKGRFNDNHGKGFFNSLGRVTEAKKILKAEDCENERHTYYWDKIKAPYVYAKGYLYNDEDHPNAKAAAAIMRNIHREDAPLAMKASVEGGVISRGISDKTRLARTKIHSVALTFTPANNATLVEPLEINKSDINWAADKQLIKSVMHLAETNIPSFRHVQRHASANTIHENIHKIQELAKSLGIDIEVKNSNPGIIMNQAVMHKLHDNINKINALVKAAKTPGNLDTASAPVNSVQPVQDVDPVSHKQPAMDMRPMDVRAEDKAKKEIEFGGELTRLKNKVQGSVDPVLETNLSTQDEHKPVTGSQMKSNVTIGRHANKAMKDPAHLDKIHSQLMASHGEAKATAVINKLKEKMKKSVKEQMVKAMTAGYGGAGAPTGMTGGGVIQSESLDDGRPKDITKKGETSDGFSYVSCDNCGHEQVHMEHQVKCRDCGKNFPLSKLESLL